MLNPKKINATIPKKSTLIDSTHTSQNTILLQSTLINITTNSKNYQTHLLFNNKSQHTFISQNLTNKIKTQPFKKKKLLINTFNHNKKTKTNFETIEIYLITNKKKIIINTLISPIISPPISTHLQNNNLNFPYLQKLRLTNPIKTKKPLKINIIINNDYYKSLITKKIIKKNKPITINNKFN